MRSLMRSKKAGDRLTKFWYPWMSVWIELSRRLLQHPFSCLRRIHGFDGFLLIFGAGCDCGCGAGCRAGGGPGVRCILFCLQIMMKTKILNSIKNGSTLTFCRKSL